MCASVIPGEPKYVIEIDDVARAKSPLVEHEQVPDLLADVVSKRSPAAGPR